MKYSTVMYTSFDKDVWSIITTSDNEVFTSFPAEIGNPNYDQFLATVSLTDEEVKKLKPDVWYDFPEGAK
jgi:hypothetical protein